MSTLISYRGVQFLHKGCNNTDIEIHTDSPTEIPMRSVCEDLIGLLSDAQATEDLVHLQELLKRRLTPAQRLEPGAVPSLGKSL